MKPISDRDVVQAYLDERISLGKAAEELKLSRFVLMEHFAALNIPLNLGPKSIEDARREIQDARCHGNADSTPS